MHADGGVNSGWGCEVSNRAYGLNDPSLEGFPFNILAAPFKAGASVIKTAAKTAVRVAPGAVTGFITGGPAGAVIGGGMSLLPPGEGDTGAWTPTPTINTGSGSFTRSNYAQNPYGVGAQAYQTQQYQRPYTAPRQTAADQAKAVFNLLKDELLATGGRAIAGTEAGQRGMRERITGDIGRYLLPISLGVGALLITVVLMRR